MAAAPPRPSMSKARRARIWERDGGVCYLCGYEVQLGEDWDAEHVIAWALSFDDSDENVKVAHTNGCHAIKTKGDIGRIAKAKAQGGETGQWARRQKRKAQGKAPLIKGAGTIKSAPFPKGRKTRWAKRPMNPRKDRS